MSIEKLRAHIKILEVIGDTDKLVPVLRALLDEHEEASKPTLRYEKWGKAEEAIKRYGVR